MLSLELISTTLAGWLLFVAAKGLWESRQKLGQIASDISVSDITNSAIQNGLPELEVEIVEPDSITKAEAEELTFSSAIGILLDNRRNLTPNAHYDNANRKHPILQLTGIKENSLESSLVVARGLAQAQRDRDGLNPKKGLAGRAILISLVLAVPLWEYANVSVSLDRVQAICTVVTVCHALLLYRDWWDKERDLNTRTHQILQTAGITGVGEVPAVHSYFHAQRRQIVTEAIVIPVAIAVALLYHYL